ncbi:hypothetical protein [uncultured Sphingomonas sp.]|uniref:hypothetical protein n=1 Tax=uncultured Sphingomonas sp. TaxID=158754 RepID=UPI0025CDB53D|nr:hypothetical protein [uncultured Sphingomonas sp.]
MMDRTLAIALCLLAVPQLAAAAPAPSLISTQFNCDALTVSQKLDKTVAQELEPAHSLEAAQAVLTRHGVPFQRSQGMMTMSGVPAKVLEQINTLPQGEPIVLPNGEGVAICVLRPSADSY